MNTHLLRRHCAVLAVSLSLLTVACGDDDEEKRGPPRVAATVDEDPKVAALDLSSTRVHVRELGKRGGDVIIVLHGGPGDDYRSMLPLAGRASGKSLADDHLLVFWDQRGTGQSRRHDADVLTLADYERDLTDLIDHYAPGGKVALLGHSWGGAYATMYMSRHPERVRAAALLEPGGLSSTLREETEGQQALFEQIVGGLLGDGMGLSATEHRAADQTLVDALWAMNPSSDIPFARMGALVLRALEFGEMQRPFDFTVGLDRIPFEVLFVVGAESDSLGKERQEQQRAFFPRTRLEIIAGADHNGLTLGSAKQVIPLLVDYFAP